MRLAFFGDVHGNLVALEAVLKDIRTQSPDMIYCLGDIVNGNVWNKETTDLLRESGIPCVQGNHDEGIGRGRTAFPFMHGSLEEEVWGQMAAAYTLTQMTANDLSFLRSLPRTFSLPVQSGGKTITVSGGHGIGANNNKRLYHFLPDATVADAVQGIHTDLLLTANTHFSYYRQIGKGKDRVLIVNPGSVGQPREGSWAATYALVDISEDAVQVRFRKVLYDLDLVMKAIQQSPLPLHYAARLLRAL